MIDIAQKAIGALLPLVLLSAVVYGQNTPAVTAPASSYSGFSLPDVAGTLRYGITATGGIRTGYYQNLGNIYTSGISGDFGYLSKGEARPFSMSYSGGYFYNSEGQSDTIFQSLHLSQTFSTRQSSFVLSDSVSYLPETPSGGLAGVPGLGDLGVGTTPTSPDPGQDVLSNFGQRISNSTTASIQRQLTGSTSLQGSGTYFLQRFLGNTPGLDIDQGGGQFTFNHRFDALNNGGGNYTYSRVSYPGDPNFGLTTQGINVQFTRQLNREITVNISIGPQRSTTAPSSVGGVAMPGSSFTNFSADGSFSYVSEGTSYTLSFFRGVRGGSGVIPGSIANDIIFSAGRRFGRYVHISAESAYNHSQTLEILTPDQTSIQTIIGNVQASRTITESLSGYVSFGVQTQSTSGANLTFNGFNGLNKIATIGITYSPSALHVGH
jgi:hypothetical protein